jgi:riboflavin synthase
MFTGIVEGIGQITEVDWLSDAARLRIAAPGVLADANHGASIAVNGICLTVVDFDETSFTCDVMAETLRRSSLADVKVGDHVNVERAARVDSRLGGHIMQGHVDGTGVIRSIEPSEHWTVITIDVPAELRKYIVEKGSIAVDGVSLTVAGVDGDGFSVSCIPTTLQETTLGSRQVGASVNIEVDVIGKYVEQLLIGYRS